MDNPGLIGAHEREPILRGSHVVETGSHEELIAKRGPYSELYGIQAAAYR